MSDPAINNKCVATGGLLTAYCPALARGSQNFRKSFLGLKKIGRESRPSVPDYKPTDLVSHFLNRLLALHLITGYPLPFNISNYTLVSLLCQQQFGLWYGAYSKTGTYQGSSILCEFQNQLTLQISLTMYTRGNIYKLYKKPSSAVMGHKFFREHIVNIWNNLPDSIDFGSL